MNARERLVDRRSFMCAGGALIITFAMPCAAEAWRKGEATSAGMSPGLLDSWIAIDSAGLVTVFCGKVELGTGIKTALAQIVAEELEVSVGRVSLIQGDTARTPDQGTTSASHSIAIGGLQLRRAAAEARRALQELAAARFGVSTTRVSLADGTAYVEERRVHYGDLIGGQRFEREVTDTAPLKKPIDYRVVGTAVPRVDIPDKVTGQHTYVQDVKVPGMRHGRVVRPPAVGAKLARMIGFDPPHPEARAVTRGDFVGVVAPTEWETICAAADLRLQWSGGGGLPSMTDLESELRRMTSIDVVVHSAGDVEAPLASSAKSLRATYRWPFQSHASIGPSCAVADVRHDGTTTVWSSTQDVYAQREALARLLGVPRDKVRVIYVEGSGCYGHNGSDDANADAALLSKEAGCPVRVQWMRRDEFGWEPRGAPYLVDLRGSVSLTGKLTGWDYQAWAVTHSARYRHYGERISGYLLATQLSGGEVDVPLIAERGRILNLGAITGVHGSYRSPNARILIHALPTTEPHPLRPPELRSVAGLAGVFAAECFIDELAAAVAADPLRFRIFQLDDQRAIGVLQAVARLSGWEYRPSPIQRVRNPGVVRGRGVGLYASATYVAVVAEVEVDTTNGGIRVTRVSVAHDCGLIVNADGLRNQIEGNVVQATSRCLLEEVAWDVNDVTSLDWASYPILRFPDVPEVRIDLIERRDTAPSGAGEATTYPMAAAIGNAIFDATGIRFRQGPFTPRNVMDAVR